MLPLGVQITGPVVRLIVGFPDQEQSTVGPQRPHYLAEMNKDLKAMASNCQRQETPVN